MPARLRDIKRALESRGGEIEVPDGTSHWKARMQGVMYTLPAHKGLHTELDDCYVKAMCRAFRLDYKSFKKDL